MGDGCVSIADRKSFVFASESDSGWQVPISLDSFMSFHPFISHHGAGAHSCVMVVMSWLSILISFLS